MEVERKSLRETKDPLLIHGIEYGRPLGQQKCSEHLLESRLVLTPGGAGGNEGYAAISGRHQWEAPRGASVVYFYLATDETEAQTLEMTKLCANKD